MAFVDRDHVGPFQRTPVNGNRVWSSSALLTDDEQAKCSSAYLKVIVPADVSELTPRELETDLNG